MARVHPVIKQDAAFVKDTTRRPRTIVVGVMLFAAALTIAYWVFWFGGGRALLASSQAASYFVFENAFPAADAWLALTLILGAIGLMQRKSWGLLFSLLAGGAGIYLGCMDVLFDLENSIYLIPKGADPSSAIIEICINILTFTLSIVGIIYLWRNRTRFFSARANQ